MGLILWYTTYVCRHDGGFMSFVPLFNFYILFHPSCHVHCRCEATKLKCETNLRNFHEISLYGNETKSRNHQKGRILTEIHFLIPKYFPFDNSPSNTALSRLSYRHNFLMSFRYRSHPRRAVCVISVVLLTGTGAGYTILNPRDEIYGYDQSLKHPDCFDSLWF